MIIGMVGSRTRRYDKDDHDDAVVVIRDRIPVVLAMITGWFVLACNPSCPGNHTEFSEVETFLHEHDSRLIQIENDTNPFVVAIEPFICGVMQAVQIINNIML